MDGKTGWWKYRKKTTLLSATRDTKWRAMTAESMKEHGNCIHIVGAPDTDFLNP